MSRAVDVIAAAALMLLLGPAYFLVWALSASRSDFIQRVLRRYGLDNIPLLMRVLEGRLTMSELFRKVFR